MWSYDTSYGYAPDDTRNNYVSTDPAYDPYSTTGSSSSMSSGIWGALLSGVGQYAGARSAANAQEDMSKLSAKAKVELAKQQRQYDKDDQQYRKDAASKWSKYFNG